MEFGICDDIVLVANNREAIQDMMGSFRQFLKKRKLELSVEKSKILVFNRKRKERKEKWEWERKAMEKVKEYKYLGFIISNKEMYREHTFLKKR